MKRYVDTIEYKSYTERCVDNDWYKSDQKSGEEGCVNVSYVCVLAYLSNRMEYQVAPMDITNMYTQRYVANSSIRELSVRGLSEDGDEESSWNSGPSLCRSDNPSDPSSDDASSSGSELSKSTVSGTTIIVKTAAFIDAISICT